MKLGVDATPLQRGKSGIGYHVEYLVRALAESRRLDEIVLLSNRRPVWDEAAPEGARWYDRHLFPKRAIWMQVHLPQILREVKPDLVHYVGFSAPVLYKHPYVVTFHDMVLFRHPEYFSWNRRWLIRSLMPRVARRALGILTVTEAARREILELLPVRADRVFVAPPAPGSFFRPIDDPGLISAVRERHGLHEPYILFVGNLEPRKNLVRLLQAFDRFKKQTGLPHRLAVVGARGWIYAPIFRTMEALEFREAVHFLDYVPLAELPALYSGAELMVFPSLYEGFGMPPVEAMRCGTPTLVSDIPPLREVTGGVSVYTDPYSVPGMAADLARILDDPALRRRLREDGLVQSRNYTWERMAGLAISAYQTVLGK